MSEEQALVEQKQEKIQLVTHGAVTPMVLLQMAMDQRADIDKLQKLMDLQMRWEANEARKAYVEAMNAFKSNPPEILKNRLVAYESRGQRVAYRHATLDNVCDQVTAALSKHGITHRWKTEQTNGNVRVTCVLTHYLGHSEETSLEASPDDTGSKNAIQAISSTVTYLERYTLLAATGLAASDSDDDATAQPPFEKLQEYLDSMSTAPNLTVLQETFKAAFLEATKAQNSQAMRAIVQCKDERKKILLKDEPAQ